MNSRYVAIVQSANAQGVTIWALDASGLQVDDMMTAENRTMENRPSSFVMRTNTQAPLQMMAEQTGGLAAINTNDWKASLDDLAADFSNFYSLGYRSSKAAVDRAHSIEVTVKRKGLSVRTRRSLLEKSVETRTAETVLASLHYPRDENPLGISLSMGQAKPYDRDNYLMPVRIAIPIRKLGLVPSGDRYEGSFSVYFVVLDASDKQSDLAVQRQKVEIPSKDFDAAAVEGLLLRRVVDLRAGRPEARRGAAGRNHERHVVRPEELLRLRSSAGEEDRLERPLLADGSAGGWPIIGAWRTIAPRCSSSRAIRGPAA